MPKKFIDINDVDRAWEFYLEDQRVRVVRDRCAAVGISLHSNTISRWINAGIPSKGVEPFKARLARIQGAAVAIVVAKASTNNAQADAKHVQAEIVDHQTATELEDEVLVRYAVVQISHWRGQMDQQLIHAAIANDKILESLMGVDPADPVAMKDVMTAWKNAVSAQRGIIETHSVLQGLGGGDDDADGRDEWIAENFSGWTGEEHMAFREHGIWPERLGSIPDFILSESDEETGTD